MIFVYPLLKKKRKKEKKTSIPSYRENDKQKQFCKTQATAITFILGLIIFYIFQRKAYISKQMAWLKEWKYRVICIHIEDFIVFFFFPRATGLYHH